MTKFDELIKYNLTTYKDFEDFEKYQNYDKDEFNDQLDNGFYMDITPIKGLGTLFDVLIELIRDDGFIDLVEMLNEDNPDDKIDINNDFEMVEFLLECYKLFKIEDVDKYYLDMD